MQLHSHCWAFSLASSSHSHCQPNCYLILPHHVQITTQEKTHILHNRNTIDNSTTQQQWRAKRRRMNVTANKRFQWMKNFTHEHDIIALCNVVWKSVYKRRKNSTSFSTKAAKLSEAWNNNWLRLFIQWNLVYSNKIYSKKRRERRSYNCLKLHLIFHCCGTSVILPPPSGLEKQFHNKLYSLTCYFSNKHNLNWVWN